VLGTAVYPTLQLQLEIDALATSEFAFDGQSTHTEEPAPLYLPAAQFMHVVDDVEPGLADALPAAQAVHVPGPAVDLKEPAAHILHASVAGMR